MILCAILLLASAVLVWPRRRVLPEPAGRSHRADASPRRSAGDAGVGTTGSRRSAGDGDVTGPSSNAFAPDVALLLDLLGAMFDAGVSVDVALASLCRLHPHSLGPQLRRVVAARQMGADWDTAIGLIESTEKRTRRLGTRGSRPERQSAGTVATLIDAVRFAAATGAPSAALLRARGSELRRLRRRDAERKAAALGVRLVLPLGLGALPAFICLGVLPVAISLLPKLG